MLPLAEAAPKGFSRSRELLTRAEKIVPGGTHTISKRVELFAGSQHYPAYLERGKGATVWDADGNAYIDYVAALGPIILGYAHPEIDAAIRAQLGHGILFSLPAPSEVELAEQLQTVVPCAERVRFFKTGAEAAAAAVRTARLNTGKSLVLTCGYHGWHDWWAGLRTPGGIPAEIVRLTLEIPFGDAAAFERVFAERHSELAAVIVTPALYGRNPPPGFLELLRRRTQAANIPLIFDEVITGFRWGLSGAQGCFGVIPDLACFGKSVANGMPLAFLAGAGKLMDPLKDNWVSSTHSGELLSIAAALATLKILGRPETYPRIYRAAGILVEGLKALEQRSGVPLRPSQPLPAITFCPEVAGRTMAEIQQAVLAAAAQRGVLLRRDPAGISLCLMLAHEDGQLEQTLEAIGEAVDQLQ